MRSESIEVTEAEVAAAVVRLGTQATEEIRTKIRTSERRLRMSLRLIAHLHFNLVYDNYSILYNILQVLD